MYQREDLWEVVALIKTISQRQSTWQAVSNNEASPNTTTIKHELEETVTLEAVDNITTP